MTSCEPVSVPWVLMLVNLALACINVALVVWCGVQFRKIRRMVKAS
jgi:hypothetical protein